MDEKANDSDKWTFEPKETAQADSAKTAKGDNKIMKYALIAVVFFAVGFLISSATGITGQFTGVSKMPADQVTGKISDFVKENLLREGSEFSIISIEERGGVYELTLEIDGNEFFSYASLDGKLLFPSGIEMDLTIEETEQPAEPEQQVIPKTEEPLVELFVMSFCPFGMQAENLMLPVVELIGDYVDITPQYILSTDDDGVRSLHGQYEWEENGRQLCIMQEYGVAKLWEYLEVFNSECNKNNLDTCWKESAEAVGIDVSVIEDCFDTDGMDLLIEQADFSDVKGITGSPTLLINGVKYTGSRTAEGFKEAICSAFIDPPEECPESLELEGDAGNPSGQC